MGAQDNALAFAALLPGDQASQRVYPKLINSQGLNLGTDDSPNLTLYS
jgi:hypothetical protein